MTNFIIWYCIEYTSHERDSKLIETGSIGSYKSNYHTIKTTKTPPLVMSFIIKLFEKKMNYRKQMSLSVKTVIHIIDLTMYYKTLSLMKMKVEKVINNYCHQIKQSRDNLLKIKRPDTRHWSSRSWFAFCLSTDEFSDIVDTGNASRMNCLTSRRKTLLLTWSIAHGPWWVIWLEFCILPAH